MLSNFLMGVIYMAIIAVIVNPSSHFASAIVEVTDALSSLTQAAIKGSVS